MATDLAQDGFQVGGDGAEGAVLRSRARARALLAALLAERPARVAAIGACAPEDA